MEYRPVACAPSGVVLRCPPRRNSRCAMKTGNMLVWRAGHRPMFRRMRACADKSFIANSSTMKWRKQFFFFCALVSVCALNAWSQDAADSQSVRPSGVSGPVRKAKAVTTKDTEDADVESTSARKTSKSTHAAWHRKRGKAKETEESIPAPTEYTPEGIPKTSAVSVIVVDANSGKTLYEKMRTKQGSQPARKSC